MSGKKYLAEGAKSRKSSIIQKILPTEFSLDEDEEFLLELAKTSSKVVPGIDEQEES